VASKSISKSKVQLPEDLETCHSMIMELMNVLNLKESDIALLKQQLQNFQRDKFGRRSEKLSPGQLSLFQSYVDSLLPQTAEPGRVDGTASGNANEAADSSAKKRNGGGGRKALSSALPREIRHYRPREEELICACCGESKPEIGHETVEQLDYTPASFKIIEHITHRHACKSCQEGVVEGKKPKQIFNGGKVTEGVIAQIATAKYADHLPLYRQEYIYSREGVDLSRSSMGRYLERGADVLEKIKDKMHELVLQNEVVQADETPLKFISPERTVKKIKTGYCWTLYGGHKYPYVIYDVQPDRATERAQSLLAGFKNFLVTDGYGGYDWYEEEKSANCNVHARRYFEKAKNYDKEKADIILSLYTKIFAIERRVKGLSEKEILEIRQRESVPIMDTIKGYLEKWKLVVLPKTPLGTAVSYALKRWEKLCRFTQHGLLPTDTNLVENSIRPVAIGRKNWMHVGDEAALGTASVFLSLAQTCKRLKVNPYLYFRDLFIRIGRGDNDNIEDLLPDKWVNKNPLPSADKIEPQEI
jgi:transposase